ncbi:hypothetical protein NDU88_004247 [Pleurodeles waltl]|uniref:Uncharacterized protein n=1 Tax=Pleurodeles waltl TaxID=8319 RepID=A0AAV7SI82_PLEWA|nr:hypothetical protein NDU88_004247 [Pleurodeles waltl]
MVGTKHLLVSLWAITLNLPHDRTPERMKLARPVGRKSRLTGSGCVDMTQGLLSNPGEPSGLCGEAGKMKKGLNLSVNNDCGRRSKA